MAMQNPTPPRLINRYNLRRIGTAKPCFICSKETVHCLANDAMSDWMYVCHGHVLDPAFAKPAPPAKAAPGSPTVPQSEIDKVKREYEEKQKRKAESSTTSSSSTPEPASATASPPPPTTTTSTAAKVAFSALKTSVSTLSSLATSAVSASAGPPQPVVPSPSELLRIEAENAKVFQLDRLYFDERVARQRREWNKRDAHARSKQWAFPKVPQGGLPQLPPP